MFRTDSRDSAPALLHVVPLAFCYLTWLVFEHAQITQPRSQAPNQVSTGSVARFVVTDTIGV
jgi:hypothetical protein